MSFSDVDIIKQRIGIADVVGSHTKLERAGKNFKARCPFHNERTPSFSVSPDRDSYYCFGCGAKGDIFTFVQEIEGVDFPGALKILADRAGVTLSHSGDRNQAEKKKLIDILELATCYFEAELLKQEAAQAYLKKRGVHNETSEAFRLGYAPAGWRNLYDHLHKEGYTASDLEKVGLIKQADRTSSDSDERYYDRFRSRIIFPIADAQGKIVAFSGRAFPDDDAIAKYLNSPETVLFNKSTILHGFDRAKAGIRKLGATIVVEGQFDLLLMQQIGFANTVAVSGTALTRQHIEQLKRLSENVIFALDSDSAGLRSAYRSSLLALSLGFDVKIVALAAGKDPADIAASDPTQLKQMIKRAEHPVLFFAKLLRHKYADPRECGKHIRQFVLPLISAVHSSIDQAHFVKEIALFLEVSEAAVAADLSKVTVESPSDDATPSVTTAESETVLSQSVEPPLETALSSVSKIIIWQRRMAAPTIDLTDFSAEVAKCAGIEDFERHISDVAESLAEEDFHKLDREFENPKKLSTEIGDLMCTLKRTFLDEEIARKEQERVAAEAAGDSQRDDELMKEIDSLSKQKQDLAQ